MFKLGCAEEMLEIPLFAELYGYGPFADRKNLGVVEPLYCRAYSFNDGNRRALMIYTDTCITSDELAREMRMRLATEYRIDPEAIAFIATHTHSAPPISTAYASSSGIAHPGFIKIWKATVMRVAKAALADEEEVSQAFCGKAPLDQPIGKNRVEVETNPTDPAIRWVRFMRPDGTAKMLLHNHGVHGIACNGELYKYASSDWMGAANRLIRERRLADMPFFMLGPAGNINTASSVLQSKDRNAPAKLAERYVDYLERDLQNGSPLELGTITCRLKALEFPTIKQSAEELQADAETFRSFNQPYWNFNATRLDEMALMLKRGDDLSEWHDLQIIRIGELEFFFVPGELYIEPGLELLEKAGGKSPLIATVSNGNGTYFFTEHTARMYPNASCRNDKKLFGFYEIFLYMHRHAFRYQPTIASFIVNSFLKLRDCLM
ncbi:MAG: hypothetical protein IJS15_17005 [Victivallales bacterium]|nr:hypothetical protein [Victivallales bacterium]